MSLVGWSNSNVAGCGLPKAAPTALRSSTAMRESSPSSWNGWRGSTGVAADRPSTLRAWSRTKAVTTARRRPSGVAAHVSSSDATGAEGAAAGARTDESTGRSSRAAGSRRTATSCDTPAARLTRSAASSAPNAWVADSASTPRRPMRVVACSSMSAVMPTRSHRPQLMARPGRPVAARAAAKASRNALAPA